MEDNEKHSGWTAAILLVIALALLPLLYVLSTGPALWLENHGYLAVGILGIVYFPLNVLCESSDGWHCQGRPKGVPLAS